MRSLPAAVLVLALAWAVPLPAQQPRHDQDPTRNNLVHPPGYRTAPPGTLGRVLERGNGPTDMILIAGAGFDGSVYESFMRSRSTSHRMFAVTLAGFGNTAAPPMPEPGTSYGEQTWTRGAVRGVERLIADRQLTRPILVAHLANATQVALTLAREHPDEIEAVVLIAGMPRFVSPTPQLSPDPATLEQRVQSIDDGYAPRWFRTVTRDTWDDNNYLPGDYARHPLRALQLWREAARPPLPVLVRYLCEFLAQDATLGLESLRVPTLVLKPGFDQDLYVPEGRDYMRAFFHRAWDGVGGGPDGPILIRTVENSRAFIMDDQPEALDREIDAFLRDLRDGDTG